MKRFSVRQYTQLIAAVLYNCNIRGFVGGTIYAGTSKGICAPGLNCYSCPGATLACPLGSLQSGLLSSRYRFPYYVLGTLLLFGILFGRLICGFLCPFGFLQEILNKIPTVKIKKSPVTRALSKLKYVILVVFAVLMPLIMLKPGFCKYICPAGTLEGGIPLMITDVQLRHMAGMLFSWKVILLIAILVLCVFCYRAFCRFLCPLGAIYSFFNPVSFFGIKVDSGKCIGCDKCVKACRMDVRKVCDGECIQCGECIKVCPVQAIAFGYKGPGAAGAVKDAPERVDKDQAQQVQ
ncbi:MAG: 4Fe-4S binding protein [Eubacterium sp.]|nr:4Fe-4S binding protein [Eubacterium sp.]